MHETRLLLGIALTGLACLYALVALFVIRPRRIAAHGKGQAVAHPVSVLKPLCGAEPDLYAQLRSFCTQDYPAVQLIFGVREANDAALPLVHQLRQEFPGLDIALVVDPTLHGCNNKISNLMNMLPSARHEWLLFADSDIAVPPEYLARVLAPLADPTVGLVTCPYRGRSNGGLAADLGTMFINEWFMPSVWLAARFGSTTFVSGATIAMRAAVLRDIGGLRMLADQLADDYRLGELVRRRGLRVVLSDTAVETRVNERSLAALCRHELRWLRTIRSSQPLGFALCLPSFPLPTALVGAALAGFRPLALALLGITAAARLVLHYFVGSGSASLRCKLLALLPLREALLVALWAWSFCRREIVWREQRFSVGPDGSLYRVGQPRARHVRYQP